MKVEATVSAPSPAELVSRPSDSCKKPELGTCSAPAPEGRKNVGQGVSPGGSGSLTPSAAADTPLPRGWERAGGEEGLPKPAARAVGYDLSPAARADGFLGRDLEALNPQSIVRIAIEEYSPDIALAFSGAEDVVLVDMASRVDLPFRVLTLDTGRLHPETYRYLEDVRHHYHINLEVLFPDPLAVEELVRQKGLFSFYRDGHEECCAIRKVEPLRRALAGLSAWMTGQRRDQSPQTRARVPVVQLDTRFAAAGRPLVKFNPLAGWDCQQVWAYIREHRVPYNPLHKLGFLSIGCEPCTRPTRPGQHERDGRWWWEADEKKECGLHGSKGSRQPARVAPQRFEA